MLDKFVLVHVSASMLVGVVRGSDVADLTNANSRIRLRDPMLLSLSQVPGSRSVQMTLSSANVVKVKDEHFLVTPSVIELLGDVSTDSSGSATCIESAEFFCSYNDAIRQKRAAQAGIIDPRSSEGSNIIPMKRPPKRG